MFIGCLSLFSSEAEIIIFIMSENIANKMKFLNK